MEYIEKYARVDGSDEEEEISVAGGDEVTAYSDEDFIDKGSVQHQDPSDYWLMHITRDLKDALADHSMAAELNLVCSDPENFVPDCVEEIERKYDKFENCERRIKKFEEDLNIFMLDSKDSFFMQLWMGFIIQRYKIKRNLNFVKMSKSFLMLLDRKFLINSDTKRKFNR